MSQYEKIAHDSVRKKDDRGEQVKPNIAAEQRREATERGLRWQIMIQLDGRKRQRPLEDQEFVEIAKHLPKAVTNLIQALNRQNQGGKITVLEFHGENNHCRDAGAAAVTRALLELRQHNIAAVRAVFLWRNELGDEGAKSVAALVQGMALPGQERAWVAEVHLSHNNISSAGALALFQAARVYPRQAFGSAVPLWLRLEHNAIDLTKDLMPPFCPAMHRGERARGVQRTVQEHNCGVSQCSMSQVPSLHLHLVQAQDAEKIRTAAGKNAAVRKQAAQQAQQARDAVRRSAPGQAQQPAASPQHDQAGSAAPSQNAFAVDEFPSLPGAMQSPNGRQSQQQQQQQQQQQYRKSSSMAGTYAEVRAILSQAGLPPGDENKPVKELSGGNRRKVSLLAGPHWSIRDRGYVSVCFCFCCFCFCCCCCCRCSFWFVLFVDIY